MRMILSRSACFAVGRPLGCSMLAGVLFLLSGCATTSEFVQDERGECERYRTEQVAQQYCERYEQQVCRTTSGGQVFCSGGSGCLSYGMRFVSVRSCVQRSCFAGYFSHSDGNCYNAEELAAIKRKEEAELQEKRAPVGFTAVPGGVFRDCAACPNLVVVPEGFLDLRDGRFSQSGGRVAEVDRFAIGQYEVTVAEWRACNTAGVCPSIEISYRPELGDVVQQLPVSNVSWTDAQLYVAWLSDRTGQTYRLPTGAEWEYAARAGATLATAEASVRPQKGIAGLFASDAELDAVGEGEPNPFGVHDMLVSVYEWTADCASAWRNGQTPPGRGNDPAGDSNRCVNFLLRGCSHVQSDIQDCISRLSNTRDRDSRRLDAGFRVVREL